MCVVGRVHVKRTGGIKCVCWGGHMCVCISNMEDVYIHTHVCIYHSPGKMLNTHRPPPLRSTHTYQPQGRVYYQEGVYMCGRSARGANQMCVVETVHVRRMKGERREKGEGKTNPFGAKNERRMRRREGREDGRQGGEDK